MVDDIKRAVDDGKCPVLLALDMLAAFDSVDHSILCSRVSADFGINEPVLNWLRSFVIGRSQYVAVGCQCSFSTACEAGVPRGSVLGPLLFSMYASPRDSVINGYFVQYHQYAVTFIKF